jgi:ankyrin repeat protein
MEERMLAAVNSGDAKLVEKLLASGADVNTQDGWGDTLLHMVSRLGDTEICKVLLQSDANVKAKNVLGMTPVYVALFFEKKDVACLIAKHKPKY